MDFVSRKNATSNRRAEQEEMTTIAAFEESRADNIISINERVDSHREESRRRVAALLDNPDQRNVEIARQMLLAA